MIPVALLDPAHEQQEHLTLYTSLWLPPCVGFASSGFGGVFSAGLEPEKKSAFDVCFSALAIPTTLSSFVI